ncbi:MAG: hypothetical protein RIC19_14915, partial [Phaeodactylibacter sp.]|uniref:hypothetical protein n=1 Tax=Phaeodactylibacter sp. TaxID=1940289 RepID=UPI0032EABAFA
RSSAFSCLPSNKTVSMNFLPSIGRIFKQLFSRSKILPENQRSSALPNLFLKADCKDTLTFHFCKLSEAFYSNLVPCAPCSKEPYPES